VPVLVRPFGPRADDGQLSMSQPHGTPDALLDEVTVYRTAFSGRTPGNNGFVGEEPMKLRIARKICKAVATGSQRYNAAQLHRALQRPERTKSEKETAAFFDEVINALAGKPTRICRQHKKDERLTAPQKAVSDGRSPQPCKTHGLPVPNQFQQRDNAMQTPCEDLRYYEAIICALVARAGGSIRLDASEIDAWGRDARLWIKPHWHLEQVSLGLDFGLPWTYLFHLERGPWYRSLQ
jgi:hypothetical protein